MWKMGLSSLVLVFSLAASGCDDGADTADSDGTQGKPSQSEGAENWVPERAGCEITDEDAVQPYGLWRGRLYVVDGDEFGLMLIDYDLKKWSWNDWPGYPPEVGVYGYTCGWDLVDDDGFVIEGEYREISVFWEFELEGATFASEGVLDGDGLGF